MRDPTSRALVTRLSTLRPGETRRKRVLQSPFRTAAIALLRNLRVAREITIDTSLGFRFAGVLPEHVSALIWRFGVYEWTTTVLFARILRTGDHVVDIGSHYGYFTLLTASLVGDEGGVIAIEAMPSTFRRLERNILVNKFRNVRAVNLAAHNRAERLSFRDFGVISSSLNTSWAARGVLSGRDAPAKEVAVRGARFDDIVPQDTWPLIRVVKIDAESSEEAVIEGMSGFFAAGGRPVLIVEMGGGGPTDAAHARAIVGSLGAHGYRPYEFDGVTLSPVRVGDDLTYMNAVFLADGFDLAAHGLELGRAATAKDCADAVGH
jgi:FkbM family methyltransferase